MPKILNVDDDPINRYIRTEVLRQGGFEVIEASNGSDALRIFEQENPPLVLLDINMPDMHGTEVCRRIRDQSPALTVMVLHISASDVTPEARVRGLEGGADGYLVEPVEPELLLATVNSMMRLWTAEAQLSKSLAETRQLAHAVQEANAELARSNDGLAQFAHSASHDLQEPLRTVAVYTELLKREYGSQLDETGQQYIAFALKAVDRMQALIHDLLSLAEAESGGGEDSMVDTGETVRGVIADLKGAIDLSGAAVTYEGLPSVRGNAAQITRLFQNLLSNSIKYRKEDEAPRVAISARREGDDWVFCVRDNGIGFEPEYAKSIFGPFKRLHGREIPGTGIGLAVVKRIVNRHGGDVWAEAEPGSGARFFFRLPAAKVAASAHA
jgi:signal transduction histidine kinase